MLLEKRDTSPNLFLNRFYSRWFCLLIFVCGSFSMLEAQTNPYDEPWRWVHFTRETGLPSNIVLDITETTDSVIWVSTANGLAWYDGFKWIPVDSTKGLPGSKPISFFEADLNNGIIAIVRDELYQGNRKKFTQLPFSHVRYAVPFSKYELMVLTTDSIFLFDGNQKTFVAPPANDSFDTFRSGLFRTSCGRIWLQQKNNIYRWEDTKWIQLMQTLDPINRIVENSIGSGILALNQKLGLGFFEWQNPFELKLNDKEDSNLLDAVDISPEGEVIGITEYTEVRIRRNLKWMSLALFPPPNPHINSVRFRKNGDLWVCAENGLSLYRKSLSRWTFKKNLTSTPRNLVNDILFTKDNSMWIASDAGIEVTSPDGQVQFINQTNQQNLRHITGLAEEENGNVWAGSGAFFSGAYCWNGKEWSYKNIVTDGSSIYVHKIVKDKEHRLWFLGLGKDFQAKNQPGAYLYDGKRFIRWGEPEGLLSGRVYSFVQGPDSSYWFGTLLGISHWKEGIWHHWSSTRTEQFPRGYTLTFDHHGALWFGGYVSSGLGKMDEDGNPHYLTVSTGFLNDKVKNVMCDSLGNLWVATMGGLACYNNDTWFYIDDKAGLPNLNVSPIVRRGDKIYIGAVGGGLCILDLKESQEPPPRVFLEDPVVEKDRVLLRWNALSYWGQTPSQYILTRYRMDNEAWSEWQNNKEIQGKDLVTGIHTFEVQAKGLFGNYDPNGGRLSFIVPLPFYQHPLFEIPIFSLSATIVILLITLYVRKRRSALILKKSELRFRLLTEAAFEGIVIHDKGIILDLNESLARMLGYTREEIIGHTLLDYISPPYHDIMKSHLESVIDKSYEIVAIKSDGTFIHIEIVGKQIPYEKRTVRVEAIRDVTERKVIEEQLLTYQEELRSLAARAALAEERERRKMATYVHDQIIQSLAFCKIQLSSMQDKLPSDNVSQPLGTIDKLLDQLINDSRSLIFTLSPPVLHQLGFEPAIAWLVEYFGKQYSFHINYNYDGKAFQLNEDMKVVLFDAVREIFVNAVKHAQASALTIDLQTEGMFLMIRIHDDGVGFDVKKAKLMTGTTEAFGLFNIRERLSHLGCDLEIESGEGKGSTFTIIAPLDGK